MIEVTGIDHIYITVSNLEQSERFYDQVLVGVLGFHKNKFELAGEPHLQYFNRHFGYVFRPSRTAVHYDLMRLGCIIFAYASIQRLMW